MACWLLIATEKGSFGGISCCGNDKGAGGGSKEGEGGARSVQICFTAADIAHIRFLSPLYIFVCVCVCLLYMVAQTAKRLLVLTPLRSP